MPSKIAGGCSIKICFGISASTVMLDDRISVVTGFVSIIGKVPITGNNVKGCAKTSARSGLITFTLGLNCHLNSAFLVRGLIILARKAPSGLYRVKSSKL